jgi:hypothetical protein
VAVIEIFRKEGKPKQWGRYSVLIDGDKLGRLRDGETSRYEVAPGHHAVAVRFHRFSSKTLSMTLAEHETIRLRCMLSDRHVIARATSYQTDLWLTLEPIEPPQRADIQVSAGPSVTGRRLSHRTIAVALGLLGLLALADTFFLFHLGESRRGGSLLFLGVAMMWFAYLRWLQPSRRVEAVKTTSAGALISLWGLSFLFRVAGLGPRFLATLFLMMGVGGVVIGTMRLLEHRPED